MDEDLPNAILDPHVKVRIRVDISLVRLLLLLQCLHGRLNGLETPVERARVDAERFRVKRRAG